MNKTINQLSDLTQIENDDELVVWDKTAGTSKKAKARQFKNIFISATSTTVTGAGIVSGDVVKIMFTSAITGSDTTTGMSISYNGTSYAVKVGKQGSLVDLVAHNISGTYTYLQAYTTLELAFDGTQFVVIGNPIVLSSDDYTIYADGLKKVDYIESGNMNMITSNAIAQLFVFCKVITEYDDSDHYNLNVGGTVFVLRLFDDMNRERCQIAYGPLSSDYSAWYPNFAINVRVNQNEGSNPPNFGPWHALAYTPTP